MKLIFPFILQVRDSAVHDVAALVLRSLKPSALFVCRSCNHSLDELQTIFALHLDLEFYDDAWCGRLRARVMVTVMRVVCAAGTACCSLCGASQRCEECVRGGGRRAV